MPTRGNLEILAAGVSIFVAWISMAAALGIAVFTLVAMGIYRGIEEIRINKINAGDTLRDKVREGAKRKNLQDIVKVVADKGAVSTEEVQDLLKISVNAAEEYLAELEESGKLEHIDHPKGGEDYRLKNPGQA